MSQLQLSSAVSARNVSLARRLLKKGANVNEADSRGTPPLIIASYNDYTDMVELLVKKGGASSEPGKC